MGRAIGVCLIVLLLAFAALLLFGRGGGSFSYEGSEAPPFSISWSELDRTSAGPGVMLALDSPNGEHLTISPLELDAAESGAEPLPGLAIAAKREAGEIEAAHPGARVALEGRTLLAVDRGPEAYQLAFTAAAGDGIVIGKRFLVPDPDRPGEGVRIEIVEQTSNPRVIEKVADAPAGFFGNWPIQLLLEDAVSVRTEEGLEKPLRSFAFG